MSKNKVKIGRRIRWVGTGAHTGHIIFPTDVWVPTKIEDDEGFTELTRGRVWCRDCDEAWVVGAWPRRFADQLEIPT